MQAEINRRGHVVFEIADNGPGIGEDVKSKIFVPFFTTKKEGSGVGLALTRQVMNAHGGAVKVANNDTGGAIFTLIF
ncbi:MAG: signal transduction histidine kinase [Alphaproteobacteria bacterium]|jgi:signal transduction histidine kinase